MLKIRLRRGGATHAPFYRIVVSDSQRTPSASMRVGSRLDGFCIVAVRDVTRLEDLSCWPRPNPG